MTLPDLQQPNTSTATPPTPSDGRNLSHSVVSQLHGSYQGQQQGGYPHPSSHYPPPVTPSHPPAPASSTSSGHSPTKDPPPSADRPPMPTQVWPQTQFFSVSFLWKLIDLPGGQINDPSLGNTTLFRSSQQLPRLHPGPLKGFLSWHGALQGPSTRLVRCFRNYRDTKTPSGVPR